MNEESHPINFRPSQRHPKWISCTIKFTNKPTQADSIFSHEASQCGGKSFKLWWMCTSDSNDFHQRKWGEGRNLSEISPLPSYSRLFGTFLIHENWKIPFHCSANNTIQWKFMVFRSFIFLYSSTIRQGKLNNCSISLSNVWKLISHDSWWCRRKCCCCCSFLCVDWSLS